MWYLSVDGIRLFSAGMDGWAEAAAEAMACSRFVLDDEDEQAADELVSCYNCRYRRWMTSSIACAGVPAYRSS